MSRNVWLILLSIIMCIIMSILSPYFLTGANLIVIIDNMALEAIVLVGIALLLITGFFDISIDGVVILSGIVAGLIMNAGISWVLACLAGIMVGAGFGLANGILVAKLNINALITTMAMLWISSGMAMGLTKAASPYGFPEAFQVIGQYRIFGIRAFVLYAIPIILLATFMLNRCVQGRHIFAIGGNRQIADLVGIKSARIIINLYVFMGVLASFIGLIMASRLDSASIVAVDGVAFKVMAACVVGGCSLSGGKGTIIGGVLGLVIMSILGNSIVLLGISPHWQKVVVGSVLLSAVLIEKINRRVKNV